MRIDKEKVLKKWAPIIESLNQNYHKNWMSEYLPYHSQKRIDEPAKEELPWDGPYIMPITRKVLKEIGDNDVVAVNPVKEDRLIIQDDIK